MVENITGLIEVSIVNNGKNIETHSRQKSTRLIQVVSQCVLVAENPRKNFCA